MMSQQTSTELSSRYRREATNDSSEVLELQKILKAYFSAVSLSKLEEMKMAQWREKYDEDDEIFPEAYRIANEQYQSEMNLNKYVINEVKEEEPSPTRFLTDQEKKKKCSVDDAAKNCQSLISEQQQIVPDVTQDTPDIAAVVDDGYLAQLQQMQDKTLYDAQNETKRAKKYAKIVTQKNGLNQKATEFVPNSQRLGPVPEGTELPEVKQESLPLTPSSPSLSSSSSILSPITQSPSENSTTCSPINSISSTCQPMVNPVNNTVINTTNIINNPQIINTAFTPSPIYLIPLLNTLSPPITQYNPNYIASTPNLNNLSWESACSVSLFSPQSSSAPNTVPIPEQTIVTNNVHNVQQFSTTDCFNNTEQTEVTQKNDVGQQYIDTEQKYDVNQQYNPPQNNCNEEWRHNNQGQWRHHKPTRFQPKFNNHAKGNFYISKDMISRMNKECKESFNTDQDDDEKLAFGYYKESVAMQINDRQINDIISTDKGLMIIINIDLHFKDGNNKDNEANVMYLIAMENAQEFRHKVRWCIVDFMTANDIYNEYGVTQLPESSRNMKHFQYAIDTPPDNINVDDILRYTNFKLLPKKTSKRTSNDISLPRTSISQSDLKYYCRQSWSNGIMVPVVVIKGKKQWIEWKKFVQIYDYQGQEQWIGISLRYYRSNRQWKIECMDYDAGRIFYQHRLVGKNNYKYTYNQLAGYITTSLDIY